MKKIFKLFLTAICIIVVSQAIPSTFGFAYAPVKSKIYFTSSSSNSFSKNTVSQQNFNFNEKYTLPSVVNSKEEWNKALEYCIDTLTDKITLTINNFDEKIYDLKTLTLIDVSIKAEGTLKNKTAVLTYTFSYKENYILSKAAENSKYFSKLSGDQLNLLNKMKKITSSIITPYMTDFEKEKAIHNYIILNSEYSKNITDSSYTVRNLINNGNGVCEAYAYLFKIFCTLSDIECEIITGTLNGQNHGWNLVRLDGEYYHIDVTSDDPVPDKKGQVIYSYFNVNDEQLSKTHIWDRTKFPKCTSLKYNYYVYNGLVVENGNQLENLILKELSKGVSEIHFYAKNFVISGANDFLFCRKSKRKLYSFNIRGDIGSSGAFVFCPTYLEN